MITYTFHSFEYKCCVRLMPGDMIIFNGRNYEVESVGTLFLSQDGERADCYDCALVGE